MIIDYFGSVIFGSPKIDNVPFVWWSTILQELARCTGFRLIVAFTIRMAICFVLGWIKCQILSFKYYFYFDKNKEAPKRNQIKQKSIWNNSIGIIISTSLVNPRNLFVIMSEKGYGFQPGNSNINHISTNSSTILQEKTKNTNRNLFNLEESNPKSIDDKLFASNSVSK